MLNDIPDDDINSDEPGFQFFAKLGVTLESLNSQLQRANDLEQQRLSVLPINIPFFKLSNISSGTTDVQDFQGPQPGREWHIRHLTAYASPAGANAAVVSWYIGQIVTGDATAQLPINMKRWEFSSLPGQQTFNRNVLVLRAGERLIAGLTNIPASSRIGLSAIVLDQPLWASRFSVATD